MTRRAATIALVVLVVLSGCNGLLGGGHDDPFGSVTFPEGASADGITNRTAIVANHQKTLETTDYEISYEIDVRERNQQLIAQSVGTRSSLDSKRSYSIVAEPGRVAEVYRNASTFHSRTFQNGSTSYVVEPLNGTFKSEHARLTGSEAVDIVLRNANFTADAVINQRNGPTLIRYTLVEADVNKSARVSSASGSFVLSQDGVVHGATLRIRGTNKGASYYVDVTYGLVQTGNVTVQRPQWIGTAVAQS